MVPIVDRLAIVRSGLACAAGDASASKIYRWLRKRTLACFC
jgi:hypothetical protein